MVAVQKTVLRFAFFIAVFIAGFVTVLNAQAIRDYYILSNYDPPAEIVKLADDTELSEIGRKLFYVHKPELNGKTDFNTNCPFEERSFVLGCYNGIKIYLLDVNDPSLELVEQVTAAHEMLHAAYDRLGSSEKERIDSLLQKELEKSTDSKLKKLVEEYRAADPSSVPTELHSIIGTEVVDIDPALEDYYSQYFNDRSVVVAAYQSYEAVFGAFQSKIDTLDNRIKALKSDIKNYEASLAAKKTEISDINSQLDSLKSSNNTSGYNALVPKQNRLVNEYNGLVASYNQAVKDHNQAVKDRNALVGDQNNLINEIDSKAIQQ